MLIDCVEFHVNTWRGGNFTANWSWSILEISRGPADWGIDYKVCFKCDYYLKLVDQQNSIGNKINNTRACMNFDGRTFSHNLINQIYKYFIHLYEIKESLNSFIPIWSYMLATQMPSILNGQIPIPIPFFSKCEIPISMSLSSIQIPLLQNISIPMPFPFLKQLFNFLFQF